MADHDRRSFLAWATAGLGAVLGTVLGVPAAAYLLGGKREEKNADTSGGFKTVALFSELRPGVPHLVVIRNQRRDAWTLHPNDVLGRAFLIRRGDTVEALDVTCPHLGCSINYVGAEFLCPCHQGRFDLEGDRIVPNPATRGMYPMVVRRNPDNPDEVQMNGSRDILA
jgi:Rieske Fe-S protein